MTPSGAISAAPTPGGRACYSSKRPTASYRRFPSKLSTKAAQALQHLGVTPLVGHTVVDIGPDSVTIR
jgi:hypothetical protein